MSASTDSNQSRLQAKLFDFALAELVHQHRDSFEPLWTVDSWAKFLIWLALNCGMSGERESLEEFADALGSPLISRMRRIYFERTLNDFGLKLIADPAEEFIVLMPVDGGALLNEDKVVEVLGKVRLLHRVLDDRSLWKVLDAMYCIPWQLAQADR